MWFRLIERIRTTQRVRTRLENHWNPVPDAVCARDVMRNGLPGSAGKLENGVAGTAIHHVKTLFGEVALERHTYPSSDGGKTFCPLEELALSSILAG